MFPTKKRTFTFCLYFGEKLFKVAGSKCTILENVLHFLFLKNYDGNLSFLPVLLKLNFSEKKNFFWF